MIQTIDRPKAQTSIAGIVDYRLEIARAAYVWQGADEVESFLRQHPLLIDAIVEARPVIAHYFGEATEVQLAVRIDPEAIGVRELVATIRSPYDVDETLTRMERFDEEWWLERSRHLDDDLLITFDYV